jgi:hypothetical protein
MPGFFFLLTTSLARICWPQGFSSLGEQSAGSGWWWWWFRTSGTLNGDDSGLDVDLDYSQAKKKKSASSSLLKKNAHDPIQRAEIPSCPSLVFQSNALVSSSRRKIPPLPFSFPSLSPKRHTSSSAIGRILQAQGYREKEIW